MKVMKLIAVFAILGSTTLGTQVAANATFANGEPTVLCTVKDDYSVAAKYPSERSVPVERTFSGVPTEGPFEIGVVQGFPISVSVAELENRVTRVHSICVDVTGAWICADSDTVTIDSVPRSKIHCEVKTISL